MFGSISDAWTEFIITHARHFGAVELHSAQTEHRQNSHTEDDDTHTAYPLG